MKENFKKFIVPPTATIKQAYHKMLKNNKQIVFICDDNLILYGLVTDGDFRRSFWSNINQENNICTIGIKKNFFYLNSKKNIKKLSLPNNIKHIPIIKKKKLIDIVFDVDLLLNKNIKKNTKFSLFILAGGYGKRLRPITKKNPKALVMLNKQPILFRIIKEFTRYNLDKIYLALFYKKEKIYKYVKKNTYLNKLDIKFIKENIPTGTAGSLAKIDGNTKNPIIITNCDTIVKYDYNEILRYFLDTKSDVTLVGFLYEDLIQYGVCNLNNKGELLSIVEKPKINRFVNCGFYIMKQNLIKEIKKNKYLNMNTFLSNLLNKKKKITFFPIPVSSFIDIGTVDDYKRLKKSKIFF